MPNLMTPPRTRATLPDFIVIGAMKAGTTSLHHRLAAHPEIGMPAMKETDFFVSSLNRGRTLDWYASQFPDARLRGEVSPNYAKARVFPGVPQAIRAALPDAKLVYLVRDPVARALSEYRHKRAAGLLGPEGLTDTVFARLIDASLYHRQASAYLEHFSADRLLVLSFEDLAAAPAAPLARLAGFLGVANTWPVPDGHANAADQVTSLPPWYWRLRRTRAADTLRARLPEGLKSRLRGIAGMARAPAHLAMPDETGLRARLHDALGEDAAQFRALIGAQFESWSV